MKLLFALIVLLQSPASKAVVMKCGGGGEGTEIARCGLHELAKTATKCIDFGEGESHGEVDEFELLNTTDGDADEKVYCRRSGGELKPKPKWGTWAGRLSEGDCCSGGSWGVAAGGCTFCEYNWEANGHECGWHGAQSCMFNCDCKKVPSCPVVGKRKLTSSHCALPLLFKGDDEVTCHDFISNRDGKKTELIQIQVSDGETEKWLLCERKAKSLLSNKCLCTPIPKLVLDTIGSGTLTIELVLSVIAVGKSIEEATAEVFDAAVVDPLIDGAVALAGLATTLQEETEKAAERLRGASDAVKAGVSSLFKKQSDTLGPWREARRKENIGLLAGARTKCEAGGIMAKASLPAAKRSAKHEVMADRDQWCTELESGLIGDEKCVAILKAECSEYGVRKALRLQCEICKEYLVAGGFVPGGKYMMAEYAKKDPSNKAAPGTLFPQRETLPGDCVPSAKKPCHATFMCPTKGKNPTTGKKSELSCPAGFLRKGKSLVKLFSGL